MPLFTEPKAFGLHPNADIRIGSERSEYILEAL